MIKFKKRVLAVLLVLVMFVTSNPIFAADWCLVTNFTHIDKFHATKCSVVLRCLDRVEAARYKVIVDYASVTRA